MYERFSAVTSSDVEPIGNMFEYSGVSCDGTPTYGISDGSPIRV